MKRKLQGFTLIELITVIAITAILLGLILIPIVQSFNLTRAAQGFADAQQKGRTLIEQVTRELSNSAGVRDNAGYRGQVALVVPGNDGTLVSEVFDNSKIDILKPAAGDPGLRGPNGGYINVNTGHEDPTLKSPQGQPVLPVAPGPTMVRWFIGLVHPLDDAATMGLPYKNPFVDYKGAGGNRWMLPGGGENLAVLFRAEVPAYVPNPGGPGFIINPDFFGDVDGDGLADLDDPYFFTVNAPGQPVLTGAALAAKIRRVQNWRRAATIMTQEFRYDIVQPLINMQNRQLLVDGNVPRMVSLIQFRPASVANEPAEGAVANRLSEEDDGATGFAPDVYKSKHGSWSSAIIRSYPSTYNASDVNNNDYLIARYDPQAGTRSWKIYSYDPDNDADGDDRNGEGNPADDMEIFDNYTFETSAAAGNAYPFADAIAASNSRSGFLSTQKGHDVFRPFWPLMKAGKVTTSIGIDKWGAPGGPLRADLNLPTADTGPFLTPINDPGLPGNFYDAAYASINKKFNKVWDDNPAMQVNGGVHRFIDLRVTSSPDGTTSPLNPDPTLGFSHAKITPGSDYVIGPDQNPGANYGQPVRYTRTTGTPNRNQYRINYVDLPEPDYASNGWAAPPATYDPTNFSSAILQARYKAGYVQLNSDPNNPLPTGTVTVYYKVQFTGTGDTITVDYDTRSQVDVLLTVRNYPQTTLPNPQNITLKESAVLRNALR